MCCVLYDMSCGNVFVLQPNAWADSHVMLDWADQFDADTAGLQLPEKLLGMDNHGAQQTDQFKTKLQTMNTTPVYTPPDCTDCISPYLSAVWFLSSGLSSLGFK